MALRQLVEAAFFLPFFQAETQEMRLVNQGQSVKIDGES